MVTAIKLTLDETEIFPINFKTCEFAEKYLIKYFKIFNETIDLRFNQFSNQILELMVHVLNKYYQNYRQFKTSI